MNGPKQDNKNQLRPHMSEGGEPLFAWRFLKSLNLKSTFLFKVRLLNVSNHSLHDDILA
jgi:hypothetical protein